MLKFQPITRRHALASWLIVGMSMGSLSADDANLPNPESVVRSAADGAIITRKDARTITQRIPAPRGLITARDGEPLAQNEVAYRIALQYRQFENADRDFVVDWARTRIDSLQKQVEGIMAYSDDALYEHYRHRRWLPLPLSNPYNAEAAKKLEPNLPSGLELQPIYQRHYPQGESAAHLIGYTGIVGKLPTGPINFNEPMWEESEGRAGLEKLFDERLTGNPGTKRLLFDEKGNKLLEEQDKRPVPGGTLVTTLDFDWQLLAEKILRDGSQRGAFVVLDAITGEVLVLASRPSFDLNQFIPGISQAAFSALNEDPATPLLGRAFQSAYPPASSYKPIVALAALDHGIVNETDLINCPPAIIIGRHTFNNWTRVPEGPIDVKRAIARSCNTWFYQVGIDVGPQAFLNLSRLLGMGVVTGLPVIGENPGLVPDNAWMMEHERRRILDGDTANLSIGQGVLLATPLQVAQAMAGIANGGALPRLQLIRQIQDLRGRVIEAPYPARKHDLNLDPSAVEIVRQGMSDVVNASGGTGRSASLSYTELCGKTGTAQWGPKSKNQRLAWFAGFVPKENPRYAFAALYEGRPNERVSGGRMAAPMVKKFFEGIKADIKENIAPPKRALVIVDEDTGTVAAPAEIVVEPSLLLPEEAPPLRALPVDESQLIHDFDEEP